MTRDEFNKYYKKELDTFKSGVVADKEQIVNDLHKKLKEDGYEEMIKHRELESDIKKN